MFIIFRSRSTEEDPENTENTVSDEEPPGSLPDVAEDAESGDSETATEVEVSEKTLKFKISTGESISSGRKSYPGSRKGSRERGQHLNCFELARAVQGEKERRKFIPGGQSFDQKILIGKKLSFDTSELLDEQQRKYFRQLNKKISLDSAYPEDLDKRNPTNTSLNFDDKRTVLKHSRPCETIATKQNNISANIMTDVCENSLSTEEKEDNKDEEMCKMEVSDKEKLYGPVSNSCKFDKITVEKDNKFVQADCFEKGDEKPSPNGNRSFLSRLKHFTDRLGLNLDRDSNSKFMKSMKFNSLSFKNNNGTRLTLPLRYRSKKPDESPCCKVEIDEERKASTLPKATKFSFGGKKSWKQRFLGRDRGSNSLDSIPPPSPVSIKASTSQSENNSRHTSPRKELEIRAVPSKIVRKEDVDVLEPDPQILATSIELM